jgi:hypothetical protein
LICGPNTPVETLRKAALTLMHAGIDIKYMGTGYHMKSRQILILNKSRTSYTLNYPNIRCNQILHLSTVPPESKNY